jgi:hypothetical protein
MSALAAWALALVLVHTLDGRAVQINPAAVVTLVNRPNGVSGRAGCVLTFVDGKFLAVTETCAQVAALLPRTQ